MQDGILFVTGMQRSGTTLLEKLLGAQPGVSVLSQPFPLLYVETKRAFLRGLSEVGSPYPLGHLFLETRYQARDFAAFLDRYRAISAHLREIFERMAGYSGQYTRFGAEQLEAAFGQLSPESGFFDVIAGLYRGLARRPDAGLYGGKETLCEEYLPYLLDRGCRCVLILRDPRDVLASLNHGRGPEFGGQLKPTLFNVRNWRKSVAFALQLEGRPGFQWLRYEDLVADPLAALQRIAQALGLGPIAADLATGDVRDGAGQVWAGNSSHGERQGVSAASVGAYRKILPPAVSRFVEASCLPELQLLGYSVSLSTEEASNVLTGFKEPYLVTREGLERDAAGPANAALEIRRLEILADEPSASELPYFLFKRAYVRLREALQS